jgi:hypothetical protein
MKGTSKRIRLGFENRAHNQHTAGIGYVPRSYDGTSIQIMPKEVLGKILWASVGRECDAKRMIELCFVAKSFYAGVRHEGLLLRAQIR